MLMRSAAIFWASLVFAFALTRENALGASTQAATPFHGSGYYYSLSKQFTIHCGAHTGWSPLVGEGPEVVRLDPNLLAISCERIKHEFLRELSLSDDQWRGAIRVELRPAQSRKDMIQIASSYYPSGWSYQMDLPDAIEPSRLIEAVVQVLLLEMANRTSTGRCSEVPAWLTYGLSQQIMQDSVIDLVVRPPSRKDGSSQDGISAKTDRSWESIDSTSERAHKLASEYGVHVYDSVADAATAGAAASVVMANPLAKAHEELRAQTPLTLEELSWPDENALQGESGVSYRNSAQLLVCDLVRLPDGRNCLRDFVGELSQYFNWQMAFQKAFHAQFEAPRDLEKWWALKVENFTERDLTQTWPDGESWRKLEEIIRPHALVRTAGDDAPLRTEMTLQNVIEDLDAAGQTAILRGKIEQLMLLRTRVSQKMVPLADSYRRALETYFRKRQKLPAAKIGATAIPPKLERVNTETIHALNGLDVRFDEMRPEAEPSVGVRHDTASVAPNR